VPFIEPVIEDKTDIGCGRHGPQRGWADQLATIATTLPMAAVSDEALDELYGQMLTITLDVHEK